MPARLLVLYGHPTDPSAFDNYYASTHVPVAKKLPGLRSYTVSSGAIGTPEGKAASYLVAELDFDSLADLQSALGSPEGAAAAAELVNPDETGRLDNYCVIGTSVGLLIQAGPGNAGGRGAWRTKRSGCAT